MEIVTGTPSGALMLAMGTPSRRLVVIVASAAIVAVAGSITAFAVWSSRQAPRVALHPAASVSSTPIASFDPGHAFGVIPSSPSASPTGAIASTPPQNAGPGPPLPASSRPDPTWAMLGVDTDGRAILLESWPDRPMTTWKWDGSEWRAVRSDPPIGYGGALTFESHLQKTVALTGGANGLPHTMWALGAAGWAQLHPATVPSRGYDIALLSWDPPRHQLVALVPETFQTSSTWTFDGVTWTRAATAINPPARRQAGMAYDPNTSRVVMYGGTPLAAGAPSPRNDTWTWDGTTWTEQHPQTTPGCRGADLAYDAATSQMILLCQVPGELSMWSWTGTTWTQLHPSTMPPAPRAHLLTYDAARGELVFFTSLEFSPGTGHTWTYANGNWKEASS